jgi:hypothetical protein
LFTVPDCGRDEFDYSSTIARLTGDHALPGDQFDQMNTIGRQDSNTSDTAGPENSALSLGSMIDQT